MDLCGTLRPWFITLTLISASPLRKRAESVKHVYSPRWMHTRTKPVGQHTLQSQLIRLWLREDSLRGGRDQNVPHNCDCRISRSHQQPNTPCVSACVCVCSCVCVSPRCWWWGGREDEASGAKRGEVLRSEGVQRVRVTPDLFTVCWAASAEKPHSEKLTQNGGNTHLIHHQASTYIAVIHTNVSCESTHLRATPLLRYPGLQRAVSQ